jgi:hypothetical protein
VGLNHSYRYKRQIAFQFRNANGRHLNAMALFSLVQFYKQFLQELGKTTS